MNHLIFWSVSRNVSMYCTSKMFSMYLYIWKWKRQPFVSFLKYIFFTKKAMFVCVKREIFLKLISLSSICQMVQDWNMCSHISTSICQNKKPFCKNHLVKVLWVSFVHSRKYKIFFLVENGLVYFQKKIA